MCRPRPLISCSARASNVFYAVAVLALHQRACNSTSAFSSRHRQRFCELFQQRVPVIKQPHAWLSGICKQHLRVTRRPALMNSSWESLFHQLSAAARWISGVPPPVPTSNAAQKATKQRVIAKPKAYVSSMRCRNNPGAQSPPAASGRFLRRSRTQRVIH